MVRTGRCTRLRKHRPWPLAEATPDRKRCCIPRQPGPRFSTPAVQERLVQWSV